MYHRYTFHKADHMTYENLMQAQIAWHRERAKDPETSARLRKKNLKNVNACRRMLGLAGEVFQ